MIYTQTKLFVTFALYGILFGIALDVCFLIRLYTKDNYIIRFICDLVTSISAGATLTYLFSIYTYGILRVYLLIAFTLGAMLHQKTIGKIFAKLNKKLYNGFKISNIVSRSKILKLIFK